MAEQEQGIQVQKQAVKTFDIYKYLEGLTGFVFDKTVLERVAKDRGVEEVESYESLTQEQKDLCRADLLYTAFCAPDVWASQTNAHGSYSKTTGSQTIQQKKGILNIAIALYEKWHDEEKLAEINSVGGEMQWLEM